MPFGLFDHDARLERGDELIVYGAQRGERLVEAGAVDQRGIGEADRTRRRLERVFRLVGRVRFHRVVAS